MPLRPLKLISIFKFLINKKVVRLTCSNVISGSLHTIEVVADVRFREEDVSVEGQSGVVETRDAFVEVLEEVGSHHLHRCIVRAITRPFLQFI